MGKNGLKKIVLIGLLLIGIILISGCTKKTGKIIEEEVLTDKEGTKIDIGVYISDLVNNPEKYYNKEITLITYSQDSPYNGFGIDYALIIKNEEGKPVFMFMNYSYFYCWKCEITGTVKRFESSIPFFLNSEKYVYYFDVSHVKSLD